MAQTSTAAESSIDRKLLNKLTEAQMARFREHTPTSAEYFDRARKVMPGGVPSSFQLNDPWPVYIDRGQRRARLGRGRQRVRGLPQRLRRHVHRPREPRRSAQAVKARHDEGTHFAAPTNGSIVVAENLVERFGLPQWRFSNSGTESTMSAIHLARGATDRDHDHQGRGLLRRPPRRGDGLLLPRSRRARARADNPTPVPFGSGYPQALVELTRPVPFNDPDVLEAIFKALRRQDRRDDHRAGDDEHQHHPAEGRLPRAGARALRRARGQADLRRGQDRRHDLLRRRRPAIRRQAGHGLPRQGDLRRLSRAARSA